MKRWTAAILIPFILIGCTPKNSSMDKFDTFRQTILEASNIAFTAEITADYGNEFYSYAVACTTNDSGDLSFEVIKPDAISGIQGVVSGEKGHLTFEDHVIAFKTIADDRVTPVTSPWVFIRALRGGYITSCGNTKEGYIAVIQDTFYENPLTLEVSFYDDKPSSAEIYWNHARVIHMVIQDFHLL